MAAHVFISYASGDQSHADEVCRLLEQHGAPCWIATRDQVAGANYDEAIVRAIDAATAVVFLLSSHANASPFVANEISYAFGKGKAILPLRLEDVKPSGALEFYLTRVHWTDGFPAPLAPHVARIVASLPQADATAPPAPEMAHSKGFLMRVDDVFAVTGRGTVGTGTLVRESCQTGQAVLILDEADRVVYRSQIEGIALGRKQVDSAQPGDEVGLLLKGIASDALARGMVVVGVPPE